MTNQTEETGVLWADHVGLRRVQHRHARVDVDHDRRPEPGDTWIIVCKHFHGAVGPDPDRTARRRARRVRLGDRCVRLPAGPTGAGPGSGSGASGRRNPHPFDSSKGMKGDRDEERPGSRDRGAVDPDCLPTRLPMSGVRAAMRLGGAPTGTTFYEDQTTSCMFENEEDKDT
jgi:hypothetical protein